MLLLLLLLLLLLFVLVVVLVVVFDEQAEDTLAASSHATPDRMLPMLGYRRQQFSRPFILPVEVLLPSVLALDWLAALVTSSSNENEASSSRPG